MAWTVGDDYNRSGLEADFTNIDGLYYYVVDKNTSDVDLSYIGFVDTIQNITYNPFLESGNFHVVTSEFNTDRYGKGEYDRKLISYIVYYTTKFEVNAYAASIYGTLKAHADELVSAHDAVDVIKYYSPVYQNYVTLGDHIQRLNIRWFDEEEVELIEDAWFSAMGEKRKCSYIIKKLTSLYSKNWRKLRKVIAKISYDVYEKYGPSYTIDDDNLID